MSLSRLRLGVLGLLAVLLVGSYGATAASANPGPFCWAKLQKEEGKGTKITEAAPKAFQGEGGKQELEGEGNKITAASEQLKGIIYNNADQCQAKIDITYHELKLNGKPESECVVTVGENNTVRIFGHQAWKYQGIPKELTEQPQEVQRPDWIFLHSELNTQKELKELPNETFTKLTFKGAKGCGLLNGLSIPVAGSAGAISEPSTLGQFNAEETITLNGGALWQHIWVGGNKPEGYLAVKTGLTFNGKAATLVGVAKVKPEEKEVEIAHFEGP